MTTTTKEKTDLEKFQALQIEALQNRVNYLETELGKAKTILNEIVSDATELEVNEPINL